MRLVLRNHVLSRWGISSLLLFVFWVQVGEARRPLRMYPTPSRKIYTSNEVLRESRPLKTPFTVSGELQICELIAPLPKMMSFQKNWSLKLCLVPKGQHRGAVIDRIQKLRGKVQITTPAQALAFVRLRTSPGTRMFIPWGDFDVLEVVRQMEVTSGFILDRAYDVSTYHRMPSGTEGIISDADSKKLGAQRTKCTPVKGGFMIARTLMVALRTAVYQLLQVSEFVGTDGEYTLKGHTTLPDATTAKVPWQLSHAFYTPWGFQ